MRLRRETVYCSLCRRSAVLTRTRSDCAHRSSVLVIVYSPLLLSARSTLWFAPRPVVSQLRMRELMEVVDMRDEPMRGLYRDGSRVAMPSDRAVFSLDVDAGERGNSSAAT